MPEKLQTIHLGRRISAPAQEFSHRKAEFRLYPLCPLLRYKLNLIITSRWQLPLGPPNITGFPVLHPLLFHPGKINNYHRFPPFFSYTIKKNLFVLAQCTLHTLQVYGEFFQANYTTHLSRRSFLSDVLWWHNLIRRSLLCNFKLCAPAMLLEGPIFNFFIQSMPFLLRFCLSHFLNNL